MLMEAASSSPSCFALLRAVPSSPPVLRKVPGPSGERNPRGSNRGVGLGLLAATLANSSLLRVRRRRGKGIAALAAAKEPEFEVDSLGRSRLTYQPQGWLTWTWGPDSSTKGETYECGYVAAGPIDGPAVVLVHGFGASTYHWRYQVPELAARGFRVYAICLLGYGWSPRVTLTYSGEVWAAQIQAFLRQVISRPAVLVGNSVGAFASLLAAAGQPELCRGLVLLNAAGSFEERRPGAEPTRPQIGDVVASAPESSEPGPIQWAFRQVTGVIAGWAFYTTKLRIESILKWVYVNGSQVDEALVTSIRSPADHPNALATFAEVIQAGRRTKTTVFEALDALPRAFPVLLIWGLQDPWMRPERAEAIQSECAARGLCCDFVPVPSAGHCPQDDTPDVVNKSLVEWLTRQDLKSALHD